MTDAEILVPLKVDLQQSSSALNEYLLLLIATARDRIAEEGITINSSSDSDSMLVEEYAAYLFRKRRTFEQMPRSLRYALNNRLFSEKGNTDG